MPLYIRVFVCIALLAAPLAAGAVDIPIPAKIAIVKPAKLAKFVSKDPVGFTLPAPGSPEDPTVAGAELRYFDTAADGAGTAVFALDRSGWTGLGQPPGTAGYKYKGKDDITGGACTTVQIKSNVIKGVCKGTAVTLTPPFDATAGIVLAMPAGTTAALRYCAELGGDEKKNDATAMKRKDAAAPAVCPAEPAGPPTVAPDLQDLIDLTDDALQGRNNNTAGSLAAQEILIRELTEMGAGGLNTGQMGDDAFKQPFVRNGVPGVNILAVIPGSDVPGEYVMIGAHYDHLGSCRSVQSGDTVCNGATDNATGVAAVLAIGRGIAALPTPPRRSVILALWDAEEDGLVGSAHYVANPLVPLASTVSYINYDIQGANLLPSIKNFTFGVGPETGSTLTALVSQAAADAGVTLDLRLLSAIFGQFRSDYINLILGSVPTVFFSDSTGPCYHTNGDELAIVDLAKLEQQTRLGYELTLALANIATPPTFAGQNPNLASYEDAVIIDEVLTAGLADLSLFPPAEQTQLTNSQTTIHNIVADGPGNFDSSDVSTLLNNTAAVIDLLTTTACDGFL